MRPPTSIATRLAAAARPSIRTPAATFSLPTRLRSMHTTPAPPATVSQTYGTGPPPAPPVPADDPESIAAAERRARRARREKHRQLLQRRRFWQHVRPREVDGAWEVHLDARPLRHPTTKRVVRVPASKPLLAAALAHEWDMLASAQAATRQHLIPLTSLVCRAIDIAESDGLAAGAGGAPAEDSIRAGIARTLMRYLDTDSLLCWAPPPGPHDHVEGQETLRDRQQRTATEIIGFLTNRVWPGLEIQPVLDGQSIMPRKQNPVTRQVVEGWVMGLSPWELAGLERGVLAGKGLLGAVRLLVEWSEGFVGTGAGEKAFGVEEAARAASLEVEWQTGNWGEVEDTHDVEKEDLRRQLGSLVLLVSGTGARSQ